MVQQGVMNRHCAPTANPFLASPKRRPLVVGHRGVPKVHQENTLAGFKHAVALGVPAIELDARLTADKRVIVFHDHSLARLTGEPHDTSDLTWDQIAKLRIRRHVPMGVAPSGASVFKDYQTEERIPLLEEVLAEVAGDVVVNVELKLDFPRWWEVEVRHRGRRADRAARHGRPRDRHVVRSAQARGGAAREPRGSQYVGFCFDDGMLEPVRPFLDRLRFGRRAGRDCRARSATRARPRATR